MNEPGGRGVGRVPARQPSWGYAVGTGVLCGLAAALLMAGSVALVYFVNDVRGSASEGDLPSRMADAGSWAVPILFFGGMIGTIVGIPAGAVLGAVDAALVRKLTPAVALASAMAVAALVGAALTSLLLQERAWWVLLSAVCAALAAEAHVQLLLRRVRRR